MTPPDPTPAPSGEAAPPEWAVKAAVAIHKFHIPSPFDQGEAVDRTEINAHAAIIAKHAPRPLPAGDRAELGLNEIARLAYENSKAHGFWEEPRNKGEMLALIHSEVSECLEGVRKPQQDDHIPDFTLEAAELADIIIRVGDYAHGFGIDLNAVVAAKMKFNASRPYKHAKNF